MLDALITRIERLTARLDLMPTVGWGVITSLEPLRLKPGGESQALDITPSTIYKPSEIGERVFYILAYRRCTILGKAGGAREPVSLPKVMPQTEFGWPTLGDEERELLATGLSIAKNYPMVVQFCADVHAVKRSGDGDLIVYCDIHPAGGAQNTIKKSHRLQNSGAQNHSLNYFFQIPAGARYKIRLNAALWGGGNYQFTQSNTYGQTTIVEYPQQP